MLSRLAVTALAALAALVAAPLPGQTPATSPAARAARPSLVVLVTVDQMRADYADRFRAQLTGGLRELYERGAVFSAAHDHAITETAPGHATLLAGRFPRSTGIILNSMGVPDSTTPLIGGGGPGASPHRYRGTVLIDWMRAADSGARALSVSRKDRGAILPLGRSRDGAFWYAAGGRFTTSTWYGDTLPTWVNEFNARMVPQSYAGRAWEPLLPDSAYAEPDSVPIESGGQGYTFPHRLPAHGDSAAAFLPNFPWMDEVTLDFALAGMRAMRLGEGPGTDLLAISLSTTDAVGHRFGPDSRELHDQILRLDRTLGRLLDSLRTGIDSGRVIVALSADHGVGPYPEVDSHDPNERGERVDVYGPYRAVREALRARGLPMSALTLDDDMVRVDSAAFAAARIPVDSVLDALADTLRRTPGVLRVDRWEDLVRADTVQDYVARRWLHMIDPAIAPAMTVTLTPYSYPAGATYAQHGTPHDYDAFVPLVFLGRPFAPGRHTEPARTVDLAPTLAAAIGVTPLERLDGRVLRSALRDAATAATP